MPPPPPPPAPSSLPYPVSASGPAEPLPVISGARPGRPRARVYTERFPRRTNTSLCSASRGRAVSPLPDNGMAISDQRCSLESE